ncbi:unnamed protein product [Phaedon cochleariae]|uniref:Small ribosomal subunit protein mS29 n=1 Tax=Phaedon cochleariae TaxID=80249 RepID=A0A9N9SIN3_PHACE|nr:unnamed protein product [Phaedon cochleariae]
MLKSTSEILSRKLTSLSKFQLTCYSIAAQPITQERLQKFRTSETVCSKHSIEHLSQFYKVPANDKKQIFAHGGLTKSFEEQSKSFNETCLMIRQPALDVISLLKTLDYSQPVVRFVLYGRKGSGKTVSLAHILHYAFQEGFLIVHIPWLGNWMRRCRENSNSEDKEGYVDINFDAAAWLLHFKTQNAHLLSKPEAKTSQDHVWSKREITPAGSPLLSIIEHGINRLKYASKAVVVICNEVKELSNQGVFKTLVAVDGFNAFFYPSTRVYTEKKEAVPPHKVTVTEGFINLSKFDWKNGAVVVTVDQIAAGQNDQLSYLPRYLLGKDGFEHLDPFVPISVPDYTTKEFISCMEYYRGRKWVQPYTGQDDELKFISASNPYNLMKLCNSL